jgi:hypothetical protein
MSADHFEATFVLSIDRDTAWKRLTERPIERADAKEHYWLPGFDSAASVADAEPGLRLRATKDDEPCAGTEIVVTLESSDTGTRITVVQSGFGDWLSERYDLMAVGWRHIVADLETYLATGVHAQRHLRAWGDLGATVASGPGGLQIEHVRDGSLAGRLGLLDGDLLVALAGAPVSTHDDLVTVLRVITTLPGDVSAEWVRNGTRHEAHATT